MDRFDIVRIIGFAICFGVALLLRAELNPKSKSKPTAPSGEAKRE